MGVSAIEFAFARIPIIAIPAGILDIGGGLGNLFEKINSKKVQASDISGFGSSLVSVVGVFATAASLGIEATLIGAQLVRIASLATPLGIGLLVVGYALDHFSELKELLGDGYTLFKEQYYHLIDDFSLSTHALREHMGDVLYDVVAGSEQIDFEKIFLHDVDGNLKYNFDYLDSSGEFDLKNKLEIAPEELYQYLNGLTIEQHSEIFKNLNEELQVIDQIEQSENPFEFRELESPAQEPFFMIDMNDSNLELIHFTKDDVRNSPLYTKHYWNGNISYMNPDLPWMEPHAGFVETPDGKFHYFTMLGINKGLSFPVFYDKNTNLPLGLPKDKLGNFTEQNTLDVIKSNPQLFDDPGDIANNTAVQFVMMRNAAINAAHHHGNIFNGVISNRIETIKKLAYADVLENKSNLDFSHLKTFDAHNSDLKSMGGSNTHRITGESIDENRLCKGGGEVHICLHLSQDLLDNYSAGGFDSDWYLARL